MKRLTRSQAGALDRLLEQQIERLTEYGARNSRTDAQRIQEVHDAACELGAKCSADKVPGVLSTMEAVTPPIQEAVPVKYQGIDFTPPEAVQKAAMRGLMLRRKYGRGGLDTQQAGEQGIGSGVARATTLASGKAVSSETIGQMVAFFARHEKNLDTPPEKGNGMIAALLWGGRPGMEWAASVKRRMDAADKRSEAILRGLEAKQVADDKHVRAVELLKKEGYSQEEAEKIADYTFGKKKVVENFDALPNKAKRAYFAQLTATKGRSAVWPVNKKTGQRRKPGGAEDLEELFGGGGGSTSPLDSIAPPKGRAPKGMGGEYTARRQIVSRIQTQQINRAKLQRTVDNYRGQKDRRREITHANMRIQELTKAINASFSIAEGPGDWGFKAELITGMLDYVSQMTRQ